MNYEEFIEKCRTISYTVDPDNGHKHHIIPKSVGGPDDESNLVLVSYGDHWEAHKLLAEENPDNKIIVKEFKCMGTKDNFVSKMTRMRWKAKNPDPETREKFRTKAMLGKHHSEETKEKISNALKNHYTSPETREILSRQKKGKHFPKISEANKGKVRTEEMKRRSSEAAKLAWAKRKEKLNISA